MDWIGIYTLGLGLDEKTKNVGWMVDVVVGVCGLNLCKIVSMFRSMLEGLECE